MPAGKGADLIAVLLRQHRAGDIDDPAARLDQRRGAFEHRLLLLEALVERARTNAPLGVRIAPPGADAGARRIDQDEIGSAGEIAQRFGVAPRGADLDVAGARPFDPLVDRRQPALVDIGRVNLAVVVHRRRQRQRLAAGAGAEIDDLLAGRGAREQRGELGAFVLDFDRPLMKRRLGMDRRALGFGGDRMRSPAGDQRVGSACRCASFGRMSSRSVDERVDAKIERRPARQRRAFGRTFLAERSRQMRVEPFRIVALTWAGALSSESSSSAALSASVSGSGAKRAPLHSAAIAATSRSRSRRSMPISDCARRRLGHQPGRRCLPAQRVINQAGNRGTIGGAGKTVRQTPVLERIRAGRRRASISAKASIAAESRAEGVM